MILKVLTEAQKRGIDDLEFIYNATRGEKKRWILM